MIENKPVDFYVHAGTSDNTRQSYQSAIKHFEVEWGGLLPATTDSIAQYLVAYAKELSINTLQQRVAAISQWHIGQGFSDPTKSLLVKKVLRGIRIEHPSKIKQAKPLQIESLMKVDDWLKHAIISARKTSNRQEELRYSRDRALLLMGFWRGFRGDELTRLEIEHIEVIPGQGMVCYLAKSKNDKNGKGISFKVPSLNLLCPVSAYVDWISLALIDSGPVFRAINRWGHVSNNGIHIDSLVPILRSTFNSAGIVGADQYSSHSLRRGFANWATSNGWDLKTLMEYVGWSSVQSAIRYVESEDPFSRNKIQTTLLDGRYLGEN